MKNTSFVDYYKTILTKVQFDHCLLAKEYQKALRTIHPEERQEFDRWVATNGLTAKLAQDRHPTERIA